MPSWSIHLNIAEIFLDRISVKDTDAFLFANVAPDIENGYLIKDISNKIDAKDSHYYFDRGVGQKLPNIYRFLNAHTDALHSDIGLGYCVHLLTDYFWNSVVNNRLFVYSNDNEVIGIRTLNGIIDGDKNYSTKIKQNDFALFARQVDFKIYPNVEKIDDMSFIEFAVKYDIPKDDILKASLWIDENYKNHKKSDNKIMAKPILFTTDEYKNILSECKEYVKTELENLKAI